MQNKILKVFGILESKFILSKKNDYWNDNIVENPTGANTQLAEFAFLFKP